MFVVCLNMWSCLVRLFVCVFIAWLIVCCIGFVCLLAVCKCFMYGLCVGLSFCLRIAFLSVLISCVFIVGLIVFCFCCCLLFVCICVCLRFVCLFVCLVVCCVLADSLFGCLFVLLSVACLLDCFC